MYSCMPIQKNGECGAHTSMILKETRTAHSEADHERDHELQGVRKAALLFEQCPSNLCRLYVAET